MNSKSAVFFVAVYFLALSVRQCYSLQCYNCIGCGDPFDSSAHADKKTECTGSCQKLKVNDIVTRNCLPLLKSDNCEEEDDNAACHCTKDLCNSASMTKTSGVFLLFLASILLRNYVF